MNIVVLEQNSIGLDIDLSIYEEFGNVTYYANTVNEVAERIKDADIVIANKAKLSEESLKDAKNVKLICEFATGYDNVDIEYCKKRGIGVANAVDYSTPAVAQHTFAMMFYLLEHLRYYDDYVKSGKYIKSESFCHMDRRFTELAGKTWGIIGLGAIGKKVAELATAFGCKVIYYSASGKKRSELYEQTDLDTLLANSDIVSCHAPLNDKTYHLMDYEQFCKMKPTAIFINVGRGPIVDEKGLAKALKKEKIGAAGLDVLEVEPMDPENPLCKLSESDRLLITPHIAWAAVEARTRLLQEVYKNLKAFQKGEKRNVCTG